MGKCPNPTPAKRRQGAERCKRTRTHQTRIGQVDSLEWKFLPPNTRLCTHHTGLGALSGVRSQATLPSTRAILARHMLNSAATNTPTTDFPAS